MWGVMRQLRAVSSGLSTLGGSMESTSRPAPASLPALSAAARMRVTAAPMMGLLRSKVAPPVAAPISTVRGHSWGAVGAAPRVALHQRAEDALRHVDDEQDQHRQVDVAHRRDAAAQEDFGQGKQDAAAVEGGDEGEVAGLLVGQGLVHVGPRHRAELHQDLALGPAGGGHLGEAAREGVHVDLARLQEHVPERPEAGEDLRADRLARPEPEPGGAAAVLHGEHPVGPEVEGLQQHGRQGRLGQVAGLLEEAHRGGILPCPTPDHDPRVEPSAA